MQCALEISDFRNLACFPVSAGSSPAKESGASSAESNSSEEILKCYFHFQNAWDLEADLAVFNNQLPGENNLAV